ncbi:beta-galactosidase [Coraliomargarita sp. W4R53]
MDHSIVFSADVLLSDIEPIRPPSWTIQNDLNFDASLACLVIRQFDSKGHQLTSDASLGVARNGNFPLKIEVAPASEVARIVLEVRMDGLKGKASFNKLSYSKNVNQLYLPTQTKINNQPGKAPALLIDGHPVPPLMVHGQNLETSSDTVASIRDIRLPYENGLRLFSFNGWFPHVTPQDARTSLDQLTSKYPEAYFMMRIWLGPRGHFFKDYPEERMVFDDGSHTTNIAPPSSERWRQYAEASIRRMVLDLRKSPNAQRLTGIIPMYYVTGEWQLGDPSGPYTKGRNYRTGGFDTITRKAFAQWALKKYHDLKGVNGNWQTNYTTLSEIKVPSTSQRMRGKLGDFRNPETQQRTIDYATFTAESLTDAIIWSAQAFKSSFHKRVVVGPFYGHLLEHAWSAAGVQEQGHFAIRRLLESDVIDFHGSPYSYSSDNRFFGLPMDTNAILDSAQLHGKPVFLEEDTYTHVAHLPDGFIAPGAQHQTKDLPQTLAVLDRNLGSSIAHGYIHYWMGLLQDGRFDLPEIWQSYAPVFEWLAENPARPLYEPQIALVIDESSIPYLTQASRSITGRWLYELRSILNRIDSTLGIYLQSDLDRIPQSVRMLVLATPYQLKPAEVDALENRWKKDDRVIVFCHMPDLFNDEELAKTSSNISEIKLSRIDASIQPSSQVSSGKHIFSPFVNQKFGAPEDRSVRLWQPKAKLPPIHPYMVVSDPTAVTLATYLNDEAHRPSIALKELSEWTSVYTGLHSMTPTMWRRLAQQAGAHLYLETFTDDFDSPDMVEASSDFLMVTSGHDGLRQVHLPAGVHVSRSIKSGDSKWTPTSTGFNASFKKGVPRFFALKKAQ